MCFKEWGCFKERSMTVLRFTCEMYLRSFWDTTSSWDASEQRHVSGIHPEFSFPVIPDMFTYPERCPPALSVYVLTHPDP